MTLSSGWIPLIKFWMESLLMALYKFTSHHVWMAEYNFTHCTWLNVSEQYELMYNP